MSKKQIRTFIAFMFFVSLSLIFLASSLDRWGASLVRGPSDIFLVRLCHKIPACIIVITISIYFGIQFFNLEKKASKIMKYIVSILGASLIFLFTFILVVFIVGLIFPTSRQSIDNLSFSNVASLIAFILASLAATHSFRATTKKYSKRKNSRLQN